MTSSIKERTGGTILIVDDDVNDRFLMSKALARVAPEIMAEYVASGAEAVAYLRGQGDYTNREEFPYPSYIITDLEMAGGNGFSVLREVRDTLLPNMLPVMMLSSSERPEDLKQAYALGATLYCSKPLGCARLRALLNAFFNCNVSRAMRTRVPGRGRVESEGHADYAESFAMDDCALR